MKKNYKVKEKNLTKLKSYLKNGIEPLNKRSRATNTHKHNNPKCSDIQ